MNLVIGSPSVGCRVLEELRQGTTILVQDESERKFEYIASSKLVENADVKDIIVVLRKKVKSKINVSSVLLILTKDNTILYTM